MKLKCGTYCERSEQENWAGGLGGIHSPPVGVLGGRAPKIFFGDLIHTTLAKTLKMKMNLSDSCDSCCKGSNKIITHHAM